MPCPPSGNPSPITTGQFILALGTVRDPVAEPLWVQAHLGSRSTGEEVPAWGQLGGACGHRSVPLCSCPSRPLSAEGLAGVAGGLERKQVGDRAKVHSHPREVLQPAGSRPLLLERWPGHGGLTPRGTKGTPKSGEEEPPNRPAPQTQTQRAPPSRPGHPFLPKCRQKQKPLSPLPWAWVEGSSLQREFHEKGQRRPMPQT